jgi:hypothetical protein
MDDRSRGPVPQDRLTSGDLFHKLVAIRTQLQLHETEAQLFLARAELARAYLDRLTANLPALEAEALATLSAPTGAKFNWSTFGYDDASAPGTD